MSHLIRRLTSPSPTIPCRIQWCRWIRIEVRDDNVERAVALLQNRMQSSGMERLIKRVSDRHVKNSEKRVLARKNLELRVRSQDLSRKLQTILFRKIRGL